MKIERKNMINLIVAVVLIIAAIFIQKSVEEGEQNRLMTGKFAIGSFKEFNYTNTRIKEYDYSYYNEDESCKLYKHGSGRLPNSDQCEKIKKGDRFLVIYNRNGSDIYFKYPIKDSTDFRRYVQEIEEMRKQKK